MIRSNTAPNTGLLKFARIFVALAAPAVAFAQAAIDDSSSANATPAPASNAPVAIDTVVVSALRTPQDPSSVPSSVTVLPLLDLAQAQISDLGMALNTTPGVTVVSYGAAGSQSALYVRGANSTQSLIVVDGVRMSSRQSDGYLRSIVANSTLGGVDRMELLRGPQGTLYGSSAMGGVLLMETTHGCGTPTGMVGVETGSFETWNLGAAVSGGLNSLGYSASIGWDSTHNWRDYNENRSFNFSTRLEEKVSDAVLVGVTMRGQENRYNSPDSRYSTYPSTGKVDSSNYLDTAYVQFASESIRSRLTYGWHQVSYDYITAYSTSRYMNTRNVADWQTSWTPVKELVVVGGVDGEWAGFNSSSVASTLSADSTGLYLSGNYSPVKDLNLQAGGRYDHFQNIGDKETGRVGAAYYVRQTGTKFRATFGTAFAVPGMVERFGDSKWYLANDAIKPESSRGWDFGVDQELLQGRVTLEGTFFKNVFEDMIAASYVAKAGKYQYSNIAHAYTEGFESAVSVKIIDGLRLRTAYTYMEVVDETTDTRPVYKPRHSGSADLQWTGFKGLVLGTGLRFVADRRASRYDANYNKVDFNAEDYTTVRVYASYELAKNLLVKARAENVLDEKYDEIYGYSASPAAVYGGIEYRF